MSSFVIASPDVLSSASADLAGIGSAIREANAAAAAPSTTSVVAAAQDEVSAAISKVFGGYAGEFQAMSAQAAAFHAQFVQSLTSGGFMYAAAESAIWPTNRSNRYCASCGPGPASGWYWTVAPGTSSRVSPSTVRS